MLTSKEKFIFYAFIREYIKEGRPLGSKYLALKINPKLPAPTLRFYFRRLTKRGLLSSLVNSLGRLPTDLGWKYYLFNYELEPEIKLKSFNPFDLLTEFVSKSHNVLVYGQRNKFKIYGLQNVLKVLAKEPSEVAEDILKMIEIVDKLKTKIDYGVKIKLGKDIEESRTKNLCLASLRKNDLWVCFLGPKRNYYHTLWSLLKKLEKEFA